MTDVIQTARTARESLARALSALQADPNVSPHLLDLAEPVAQAMGALHQIERSGGTQLLPFADHAITSVRAALSQLQSESSGHPNVTAAMEAVASSLSNVYVLSKLSQARPTVQPAPAVAAQHGGPHLPQAAHAVAPHGAPPVAMMAPAPYAGSLSPSQHAPAAAPYVPPPQVASPQQGHGPEPVRSPSGHMPATHGSPIGWNNPPPPPSPSAPALEAARAPVPDHPAPFFHPGVSVPTPQAAPPRGQQAEARPAARVGPDLSHLPRVEVELGAYSASNFYKGLSGTDVVDHGGLFVSTYKIPSVGTTVHLHVTLPGGYEIDTAGVVGWTREPHDTTPDVQPGFGAKLSGMSAEARQLVYRYTRNREPMFFDDM